MKIKHNLCKLELQLQHVLLSSANNALMFLQHIMHSIKEHAALAGLGLCMPRLPPRR